MSEFKAISNSRDHAYRILIAQIFCALLTAIIVTLSADFSAARSMLLGCCAFVGPNAYFIRCAFRRHHQQSPRGVLLWFYIGEAGKLILTALIFAAGFMLVEQLQIGYVFLGYLLMMLVNISGLVLMR